MIPATETRAEALDRLVNEYHNKVKNLPAEQILTTEQFRTALDESIAKTGRVRLLKNPPTFRERPHGSMFLRLYRWHGTGGELTGYFMAREDHKYVVRTLNRPPSERRGEQYDWLPMSWPSLDAFDNTAIIARGGSPATEAWQRALSH